MLEMQHQRCKQLAMSRNHQNAGDEKEPYMSIKYTEVSLDEKQVDALMGFGTYKSWFNINGKQVSPMDWTKKVELKCEDAFKGVSVAIQLSSDKELEFDECRLYIDSFKLVGGDVIADLHIHVMGAKDSEWNLIGRSEYTEVKLSLGDGVLIERKARKQRDLPFDGDPEATTEAAAPAGENDQFEKDAKEQVAAFNRGRKGRKPRNQDSAH